MTKSYGERGQTIILVAISIVSLLAMAALAIDVITLYVARSEVRRAADAAAIAGAQAVANSGVTTLQPGDANLGNAESIATAMANSQIATIVPANLVAGSQPTIQSATVDFNTKGNGNPLITVTLLQSNVPTFFAKIWGHNATSVSGTAVAEAYNPSNNSSYTPIAPSAVKPWLVANIDPKQSTGTVTSPFINVATGNIEPNVIGEQFNLLADCPTGCPKSGTPTFVNNGEVEYVAAAVTPDTLKNVCTSCAGSTDFERAIECADFVTQYSCGVGTATVDTVTNPSGLAGPSAAGAECLTHATGGAGLGQGQDLLNNPIVFPTTQAQITAESGTYSGQLVSTSNSIVTIPIVDQTQWATYPTVNIVGYLQAFINQVQQISSPTSTPGDINITVLNVSGCGGASNGNPAVVGGSGTSPVPVRLISAP